jgi:hypothetical protein
VRWHHQTSLWQAETTLFDRARDFSKVKVPEYFYVLSQHNNTNNLDPSRGYSREPQKGKTKSEPVRVRMGDKYQLCVLQERIWELRAANDDI